MDRGRYAATRGHDALPTGLLTTSEVMAVGEAAQDDPAMQRILAERDAMRRMHAAMTGTPSALGTGRVRQEKADAEVRRVRARQQVAESAAQRAAMTRELGLLTYSDDPDDYYNAV